MAGALTQAERLRRHNDIFRRAMRDNVTLAEAEKRIALEQVELSRRAIEAVRNGGHAVPAPTPAPRPAPEHRLPWWQDGQYQ